MKKVFKVGMMCLLTAVMSVSIFGCNTGGRTEYDKNKTQLFVRVWDNGFGTEYADLIKARFEEAYKDEVYEEGKTGVEVIVNPALDSIESIRNLTDEVFFGLAVPYFDLAAQGLLMDLSDILQSPLPGEEDSSISSKLKPVHKDALKALDGKYYAFPYLESFTGLIYDVDYFESQLFYFAENGEFVTTDNKSERSLGADGIKGTYDDGLPQTYIEFFKLCDRILTRGGIPMIWTGQYKTYMFRFLRSLAAAYEGYESYAAKYGFEGQVEVITGWTDQTIKIASNYSLKVPVTEMVTITPANGYLLQQAAGKYYALAFLEAMLSNSEYYHSKSFSEIESHHNAQEDFIMSKWDNNRIAMLIDGNYWEGEAKPAIERSYSKGASARNRNYGVMPLPSYVSAKPAAADKITPAISENSMGYMLINGNIAESREFVIPLAKEFLKFCYTDASLAEVTKTTGSTVAVSSEYMGTQGKQELTRYKRDVWEHISAGDVVYSISKSQFFITNINNFVDYKFSIAQHTYPQLAMKNSGVSAEQYFKGLAVTESFWKNQYGV